MLDRFDELLSSARRRRAAVGSFTCYTFEGTVGVLRAAEARREPAILLVSAQAFTSPQGADLVAMLLTLAERAAVPVAVQLDHVSDLQTIERAFEQGVHAVMADGSHLPLEQNVAFVRDAVAIADDHGGHVEAEIAGIAGDEELAQAIHAGAMTDPAAAARLVQLTGAACLAVAIGNVHGHYAEPPQLDFARLQRIAELVEVPLSLHGASGLPEGDLRAAVAQGVAKVNVNTELRAALLSGIEAQLPQVLPRLAVLELTGTLVHGVATVVDAKLAVLAAPDTPAGTPR